MHDQRISKNIICFFFLYQTKETFAHCCDLKILVLQTSQCPILTQLVLLSEKAARKQTKANAKILLRLLDHMTYLVNAKLLLKDFLVKMLMSEYN